MSPNNSSVSSQDSSGISGGSPSSAPVNSSPASVPGSSSSTITPPAAPSEKDEKILIAYFSRFGNTAIKIRISNISLDGVLYNTALAEEIKRYFPLTVSMSDYGGREYYGGVSFYPNNTQGGKKTFENGDITYCEPHHNMAIFYAQTSNPNLSVDVIPIGKVTSDLSVFDNLGGRETVTF